MLVQGDGIRLKGGTLDKATFTKIDGGGEIKLANGDTRSIKADGTDQFQLKEGNELLYRVKVSSDGYSIFSPTNQLINRVKIKDDKFNIYDGSGARILHGKAKEDGYGVKSEKGEQVVKIKGVTSLKEAAPFGLPIAAPFQILLWSSLR